MSYQQEVNIARSLMESEGSDVEFLSIHEAIGGLVEEGAIELTEEEVDAMALRIDTLIDNAVVTFSFPEEEA